MRILTAALLLFCLAACGYNFPGKGSTLPGGVEKLYVPIFTNKTIKPRLDGLLSNDISLVFARNKNIQQVNSAALAEAVLEGTVSSYSTRALSYDKNDDISQYRATVVIDVTLKQVADGKVLWQGTLSWQDDYIAAGDKSLQSDLENDAIREISNRLAEELLSRLLDDF